MIQRKRTQISIKTRDILVVRNGAPPPALCCPNCGERIEIMTGEQAAAAELAMTDVLGAEVEITEENI